MVKIDKKQGTKLASGYNNFVRFFKEKYSGFANILTFFDQVNWAQFEWWPSKLTPVVFNLEFYSELQIQNVALLCKIESSNELWQCCKQNIQRSHDVTKTQSAK